MPDVEVTLETGGEVKNGSFSPTAGTEIAVSFDPLKTKVGVDYSRDDRLVLTLSGELPIKSTGLELGLTGTASVDGKASVNGSVTWDISKSVSAKADVTYGSAGASGTASLTIKFG